MLELIGSSCPERNILAKWCLGHLNSLSQIWHYHFFITYFIPGYQTWGNTLHNNDQNIWVVISKLLQRGNEIKSMCLKAKFCVQIEEIPLTNATSQGFPHIQPHSGLLPSPCVTSRASVQVASRQRLLPSASPQLSGHARLARGYFRQ